MKKINLTLIVCTLSAIMAFSQNQTQKEELEYKHSFGMSLFMLYNFTDDSPDYFLLTYGYQLTPKDRIFPFRTKGDGT